jgi:hypothetical protein
MRVMRLPLDRSGAPTSMMALAYALVCRIGGRTILAVSLLFFQLAMIVYAQFVPWRYFCWAPNDYNVEYTLAVTICGRRLSPQEALERYHLSEGKSQNPAEHIIDMVRQYEETYGNNDHAQVVLRYRVNGRSDGEWRWPRH